MCSSFRDFSKLGKLEKIIWIEKYFQKHDNFSQLVKKKIFEITENAHFTNKFKTRVKCDLPKECLGAALEQKTQVGTLKSVALASPFLKSTEMRCSSNDLELLAEYGPRDDRNFLSYNFHI